MNIREAILKAADHIERNPALFNFYSYTRPDCGTPGCALGWIGTFMAVPECNTTKKMDEYVGAVAIAMNIPPEGPDCGHNAEEGVFYQRLNDLYGAHWSSAAPACAAALRLYADKYHPAEYVRDEAKAADFLTALNKLIRDGANHPASRAQV